MRRLLSFRRCAFGNRRALAITAAIVFACSANLAGGPGISPAIAQPPAPSPQPEAVLDHFLCYRIAPATFAPRPIGVVDQFHFRPPWPTRVVARSLLCNPVTKYRAGEPATIIRRPASHLVCYQINPSNEKGAYLVSNQLTGGRPLRVSPTSAAMLCLPSAKALLKAELPAIPTDLDHFKCYGLVPPPPVAAPPVVPVGVRDQFGLRRASVTLSPQFLCNPALKVLDRVPEGRISHSYAHLVCYPIRFQGAEFRPQMVRIRNQFELRGAIITAIREQLLCVPSTKTIMKS